jgi:hypothetical protein
MLEKGAKCLALSFWQGAPVWVPGKVNEVIELKTQRVVVVEIREDHRDKVGGNGVLTVPPEFCFDSFTAGGDFLNRCGAELDRTIAAYVPEPSVIQIPQSEIIAPSANVLLVPEQSLGQG